MLRRRFLTHLGSLYFAARGEKEDGAQLGILVVGVPGVLLVVAGYYVMNWWDDRKDRVTSPPSSQL